MLTQQAIRFRGKDASGQTFLEAPDASFGYNPGVGWALWDKLGASPDQVGGRGKGVAIIEPNQPTHEDYGLPSIKDYPSKFLDEAPKVLPSAQSLSGALRQINRVILQGKGWRQINTPVEPVFVKLQHMRHMMLKREHQRERFANFILPTLEKPNEVWLTEYKDGFRRQFIKSFKSKKNMLIIVRENQDGSLFLNAIFTSKVNYINNQRKGVLLYENK